MSLSDDKDVLNVFVCCCFLL